MKWVGVLIFLASCCGHGPLNVRHQYLDARYLASSHVGTPDPRRCDFYGQQIIIQWSVPKEYRKCRDLSLLLTVRYGAAEVKEIVYKLRGRGGTCRYRLMNESFCDKRGVVTYKIEMRAGDTVIYDWHHQVWAELIDVGEEI